MVTRLTTALASLALAGAVLQGATAPLVIAHRGASGHRPEHTLEAYALAISMGADVIEPDLVATKDGVLVARHENEIGATTDVATKFGSRKTTKTIDGRAITGWFTEDFTLAELKTLRANERLEARSHAWDGRFPIPTFEEVLTLAATRSAETGRTIAVYPETKHPAYFRSIGLPLEERLVSVLAAHGMTTATAPVFIQSFEADSLKRLRAMTGVRLVFLTSNLSDAAPARLKEMGAFADGIGAEKRLIIPVDNAGVPGTPTPLVRDAHAAGLFVHVWTLRADAPFLPAGYKGNAEAEARDFVATGVDGIFTDFPDVVARAVKR